jgi:hypothetical protein
MTCLQFVSSRRERKIPMSSPSAFGKSASPPFHFPIHKSRFTIQRFNDSELFFLLLSFSLYTPPCLPVAAPPFFPDRDPCRVGLSRQSSASAEASLVTCHWPLVTRHWLDYLVTPHLSLVTRFAEANRTLLRLSSSSSSSPSWPR